MKEINEKELGSYIFAKVCEASDYKPKSFDELTENFYNTNTVKPFFAHTINEELVINKDNTQTTCPVGTTFVLYSDGRKPEKMLISEFSEFTKKRNQPLTYNKEDIKSILSDLNPELKRNPTMDFNTQTYKAVIYNEKHPYMNGANSIQNELEKKGIPYTIASVKNNRTQEISNIISFKDINHKFNKREPIRTNIDRRDDDTFMILGAQYEGLRVKQSKTKLFMPKDKLDEQLNKYKAPDTSRDEKGAIAKHISDYFAREVAKYKEEIQRIPEQKKANIEERLKAYAICSDKCTEQLAKIEQAKREHNQLMYEKEKEVFGVYFNQVKDVQKQLIQSDKHLNTFEKIMALKDLHDLEKSVVQDNYQTNEKAISKSPIEKHKEELTNNYYVLHIKAMLDIKENLSEQELMDTINQLNSNNKVGGYKQETRNAHNNANHIENSDDVLSNSRDGNIQEYYALAGDTVANTKSKDAIRDEEKNKGTQKTTHNKRTYTDIVNEEIEEMEEDESKTVRTLF